MAAILKYWVCDNKTDPDNLNKALTVVLAQRHGHLATPQIKNIKDKMRKAKNNSWSENNPPSVYTGKVEKRDSYTITQQKSYRVL